MLLLLMLWRTANASRCWRQRLLRSGCLMLRLRLVLLCSRSGRRQLLLVAIEGDGHGWRALGGQLRPNMRLLGKMGMGGKRLMRESEESERRSK